MSEKKNVTNENQGNPIPEEGKGKVKRPNIAVRIWHKICNGAKAVRESPVATAIGAAGGAVLTGVGVITYSWLKNRNADEEELEPIEQEFEEEEYEPEEEVQDEETAE